jgi:hypothetical protein
LHIWASLLTPTFKKEKEEEAALFIQRGFFCELKIILSFKSTDIIEECEFFKTLDSLLWFLV